MESQSSFKPKIGNVNSTWGQQRGQPVLILQNALGLHPSAVALPASLAMLPALCDGSRDVDALRASLMVRAGVRISPDTLAQIIQQMDEALLFENGRQAEALRLALAAYRQSDGRPPVSTGISYPADSESARAALETYMALASPPAELPRPANQVRAMVSPHIDYPRGGRVYASVWGPARPAIEEAELIVIMGTDHRGPAGSVTLTRQSYRTPWGTLKTDDEALAVMLEALGEEAAFAHEYHHAVEHSVELSAVWLHFIAPQAHFSILPIIFGSFAEFINSPQTPEQCREVEAAVHALRSLLSGPRRTILVASVDLAHIGPAFGGPPAGLLERGLCRAADETLLNAICAGDALGFLQLLRQEADRRNVCGAPALYVLLNALGPAEGLVLDYEQCPADQANTSFVSIAGALLW